MKFWIATIVLLTSVPGFAQKKVVVTTNGAPSQVTKTFRQAVKDNKVRVLVPTYVPPGYRLVRATIAREKEMFLRDMTLVYENAKTKGKFIVQMASDGLGDPFFDLPNGDTLEPTGTIQGRSPIFGPYDLDHVTHKGRPMWHTTWYDASKTTYPRSVLVMGEGLPVRTGKTIIESLRWLVP